MAQPEQQSFGIGHRVHSAGHPPASTAQPTSCGDEAMCQMCMTHKRLYRHASMLQPVSRAVIQRTARAVEVTSDIAPGPSLFAALSHQAGFRPPMNVEHADRLHNLALDYTRFRQLVLYTDS